MKKNQVRKIAEETFVEEEGRITNKELAARLNVHPATIARWRRLDDWDMKLMESMSSYDAPPEDEEDPFEVDFRHLGLLNDSIDRYLKKRELLPSEIRDLAEAKFHVLNCMELIRDRMIFPFLAEQMDVDTDFD